jgi:hypothetical protein
MAEALIGRGSLNVAFFSRGGCPIPWFTPWAKQRHNLERYKLCKEHSLQRLAGRLEDVRPGDQLVLSSKLPGYLLDANPKVQAQSMASYASAIRNLARELQKRGAGLIITGPLPTFKNRPAISVPMSLCQREWYRPFRELPPGCAPTFVSRADQVERLSPLQALLLSLEKEISNLHVFQPFPLLCPPADRQCSTHRGERMLFVDSNHLSREGLKVLEEPFLNFLNQRVFNHTVQHGSSIGPATGSAAIGSPAPSRP